MFSDQHTNNTETTELSRHLRQNLERMENERKRGWDAHWRDLAANFLPRRSRFLDAGDETNNGEEKNLLEDAIGILALRTLASGMQAGLTSPARPWFSLAVRDQTLAGMDAVKDWLHKCYLSMQSAFARSNFYDQVHILYRELGVFGTAVMFVEEDADSSLRFRTETAGTFCLDVNASHRVDTLYRRIRMTPRQIAQAWPQNCPDRIRGMAEKNNGQWLTLLHAVEPNPDFQEGGRRTDERPYRSVFMLLEGGTEILEVGGYYEFPAMCPRWDTTAADIYGSSPAMDALSDCRQLQKITEDGRIALEKEVNPPLLVLESSGIDSVDVSPGALTFAGSLTQGQPSISSLYSVRANFQALEVTRTQIKQQIREMFFNDLFLMISKNSKNMSATEVLERNNEKLLLLGPVLDRLRSELFQPLIERVFGILRRSNLLPPIPPALPQLADASLSVEFISILALAQRHAGLESINQTVAFIGQLAALTKNPAALDKLNIDEAVNEVAQMNGLPPKIIRSDEEVLTIRRERASQAQTTAAISQSAEIMKGIGSALTG